jgi:8-oxo-dGTP pyrophosphatase MutT (NUDIX family)
MLPVRWSPPPRIRPIVICVVRRDDLLLVFEALDESKNETFYRPLGGGIQFGEYGETAVRREMREELGIELRDVRYVATLENIYTAESRPGHEIVLVFQASLADEHVYAIDENGWPRGKRSPLQSALGSSEPVSRWRCAAVP